MSCSSGIYSHTENILTSCIHIDFQSLNILKLISVWFQKNKTIFNLVYQLTDMRGKQVCSVAYTSIVAILCKYIIYLLYLCNIKANITSRGSQVVGRI